MKQPGSRPTDYDDDEHVPLTPRGMAAAPASPPGRRDPEAHRPATIRIEANTRPMLMPRRDAAPAQAVPTPVRPAAPAPSAPHGDTARERLHALVLSQGLLLNAFVLLLVFGWSSPLPGRRLLLGAFAVGGIVLAVLIHFALRTRAGRAPKAKKTPAPRSFAMRALPAAMVTAWVALGLYALALPPTANAFQENRPAAATALPAAPAAHVAAPAHEPVAREAVAQPSQQATRRWNFRP